MRLSLLSTTIALAMASLAPAASGQVTNGDFQANAADFDNGVGYVDPVNAGNPSSITGWTNSATGLGINGPSGSSSDPFLDNGTTGSDVAFIQATNTTLTQTVNGLTVGQPYQLTFQYNARNCCGGTAGLVVSIGPDSISTGGITPVGGGNPFPTATLNFTPTASSQLLTIQKVDVVAGDSTALIDNVTITPVPEPATAGLAGIAALGLLARRRR